MRGGVLRFDRLRLIRTVAVAAVASLGAGCSADVSRFNDGFYTGAVPQRPVPQGQVAGAQQSYPGNLDATSTGSVGGARQPLYDAAASGMRGPDGDYAAGYPQQGGGAVQRSNLAPPPAIAAEPRSYAAAPQAMPATEPASRSAASSSGQASKAGWNRSGNHVTLRQGETLETVANRYGVPVKAIIATNGLSSPTDVAAGQTIEIPTYSYGNQPSRTAATAAAPAAKQPAAGRPSATPASVTVAAGDSLTGIARRAGVSVADLRAANGMTGDTVRIGQKLALPNGAVEPKRVASLDPKEGTSPKPAVKPAAKAMTETTDKQPKPYQAPEPAKVATTEPAVAPAKPAAQPKLEASAVPAEPTVAAKPAAVATTVAAEEERETAAAPAATGIDQFRWPVQGRVIRRFGEKEGTRRNDGLDISVPRGTAVKAAENGVVIYAGDGLKEFGNTVLVRHDNGLVTVYGHADDLKVKRGEQVKRGQEIATAGMSGDAKAPMLHFEVRKNSAPVDPGKYLQ